MTKTSTQRLSEVARYVVAPEGLTSTGWPAVRDTCERLGWSFDGWQDGAGRLLLGKRGDGLYAADLVAMSIPRQVGKALDVDTPILTANRGWVPMGDLCVGDAVFHPDGHPTDVVEAHDWQRGRRCYEVTTTDGRSVVADEEHLWTVQDRRRGICRNGEPRTYGWETLTTAQLIERGLMRHGREFAYRLPKQHALVSKPVELPIDPYLMGVWLGDGTSTAAVIAVGDVDLPETLTNLSATGAEIVSVRRDKTCWAVRINIAGAAMRDGFFARCKKLGVTGKGNKRIPDLYLTAGTEQRLALLQGLLDSDGSITKSGLVEFCSTTRELADGVLFLARSLGWRAYFHESESKIHGRYCGQRYRVTFSPDIGEESPFRLRRKAERVRHRKSRGGERHAVSIRSIREVESRPVRCIRVDRWDGLFLAGRDLIATHNTFFMAASVFALCLLNPGLTVIWTAHRVKTAKETFNSMSGMAAQERVAPHIKSVIRARGDESITFINGSRILFGAREAGFGRGFTNVSILVFDEAQILTESAMEDMVASQNVAANPLTILAGTPPRPRDPGEVFTMVRQDAISGDSKETLYIELSADEGCDLLDRKQWRKANPSFPHRTPERAMLRMKKNLSDDSFRREALGVWDAVAVHQPLVTPQQWREMSDIGPADNERPLSLGVDMSHARDISIAACWVEEESAHIEEVWNGTDPAIAIEWIVARAGRRVPVVIDSASPASSLVPELKARKVRVVVTSANNMAQACGLLEDRLSSQSITHASQRSITDAILSARRRPIRDAGGWALDRSDPTSQIYPIVAATLALFGATAESRPAAARSNRKVRVLN
jgi:hypothetical protein